MTTDKLIFLLIEGVILLVVGIIINKVQTRKAKLISYVTNASFFDIPGRTPPMRMGTHTIVIRNVGRGNAENIEVCHRALPFISVVPDIQYTKEQTPQKSHIIKFENLASKNTITISYLYFMTPDWVNFVPLYTKSKEGNAKVINTIPTPIYSKWLQVLSAILLLFGAMFFGYLIYELILYIN